MCAREIGSHLVVEARQLSTVDVSERTRGIGVDYDWGTGTYLLRYVFVSCSRDGLAFDGSPAK